uniref:Uncharacterized protein n=1 Tax=Anguilla anguilla TaxID=7936 RepID=A0A0E9TII0_ANGAN
MSLLGKLQTATWGDLRWCFSAKQPASAPSRMGITHRTKTKK